MRKPLTTRIKIIRSPDDDEAGHEFRYHLIVTDVTVMILIFFPDTKNETKHRKSIETKQKVGSLIFIDDTHFTRMIKNRDMNPSACHWISACMH
jgi:hypothetical protein